MREAFAKFDNMAMLWSIGKDSTALLWLARKAFFGHVPFPLVHIDTTYKIPSMIEYRDRLVREWNLQLVVGMNKPVLEAGHDLSQRQGDARRVLRHAQKGRLAAGRSSTTATPASSSACGATKIPPARRSGISRRATRTWSGTRRTSRLNSGTSSRPISRQARTSAFIPLLHWTELNMWEYIEREKIPVIPLYFDDGTGHRYRSLGCAPCTFPIKSTAKTVAEIIEELKAHQNPRARGPRAGSGKRRRVREAPARRLHVMAFARNQLRLVVVGHVDHGKSTLDRPAVLRHRLAARRQVRAAGGHCPAARRAVRVRQPDGRAAGRARPEHHHRHHPDLVPHPEARIRHHRRARATRNSSRTW